MPALGAHFQAAHITALPRKEAYVPFTSSKGLSKRLQLQHRPLWCLPKKRMFPAHPLLHHSRLRTFQVARSLQERQVCPALKSPAKLIRQPPAFRRLFFPLQTTAPYLYVQSIFLFFFAESLPFNAECLSLTPHPQTFTSPTNFRSNRPNIAAIFTRIIVKFVTSNAAFPARWPKW
jgi:hypothetical protein